MADAGAGHRVTAHLVLSAFLGGGSLLVSHLLAGSYALAG